MQTVSIRTIDGPISISVNCLLCYNVSYVRPFAVDLVFCDLFFGSCWPDVGVVSTPPVPIHYSELGLSTSTTSSCAITHALFGRFLVF